MQQATSPYLNRPLRTLEQAQAERAERERRYARRRCADGEETPRQDGPQEQGIAQVSAYPKRLLRERMGL